MSHQGDRLLVMLDLERVLGAGEQQALAEWAGGLPETLFTGVPEAEEALERQGEMVRLLAFALGDELHSSSRVCPATGPPHAVDATPAVQQQARSVLDATVLRKA